MLRIKPLPAFLIPAIILIFSFAGFSAGASTENVAPQNVPRVISFNPQCGPVGSTVQIFTSGFVAVNTVTFNQVPARFSFSSGVVTTSVPPGATTGEIAVVASPGQGGSAVSQTPFRVTTDADKPAINDFTPPNGPVGTEVRIVGTNFALSGVKDTPTVKFNNVPAPLTSVTATEIHVKAPSGATTGRIAVSTCAGSATSFRDFIVDSGTGGDGPPTSAGSFNVILRPAITGFAPASGQPGTKVTVSGRRFNSGINVLFTRAGGGFTEAQFTVLGAQQLEAIAPQDVATGAIRVRNADGPADSATPFTVPSPCDTPTITNVAPATGEVGTLVTITGTNFNNVQAVKFGNVAATFVMDSQTQIRATIPQGVSGQVQLCVIKACGQACVNFTVGGGDGEPSITFTPASGEPGAVVQINAKNFVFSNPDANTPVTVSFNGVRAFIQERFPTTLKVVAPETTDGPITVQTSTRTVTSTTNFDVLLPPVITAFTPASGAPCTMVTISGHRFNSITEVTFRSVNGGRTPAAFTVNRAQEMVATVPPDAATGGIRAKNADGGESARLTSR